MGSGLRRLGVLLGMCVVGCGDEGPNEGREARPAEPVYDGPLGDNGEFLFTPGPPGSFPGVRVEVEVNGEVFASDEFEILMREWDGVTTVERELVQVDQPQFNRGSAAEGMMARLEERLRVDHRATIDVGQLEGIHLELAQRPAPARVPRTAEIVFAEQVARVAELVEQAERRAQQKDGDCPEGTRAPFTAYEKIGTLGGVTFWTVLNFAFSETAITQAYSWALHFAPEGVYFTLQEAFGAQIVPSIGFGVSAGVGVHADAETLGQRRFSASTVEGKNFAVSYQMGVQSFAVTLFQRDGWWPHRAIQFDAGYGLSVPLEAIFTPIAYLAQFNVNVGISEGKVTTRTPDDQPRFVFLAGYTSRCSAPLNGEGPVANEGTMEAGQRAFGELRDQLQQMEFGADGRESPEIAAHTRMFAESIGPIIESIGGSVGTPPSRGIAPGTNGGALQNFGRRNNTDPCRNCPETEIDGFIDATFRRFQATNDDRESILEAGADTLVSLGQALPQQELLASQRAQIAGAVDGAFALGYAYAGLGQELPNTYISSEVVDIDVRAGEPAYFEFTAEEIGELIGRPPEDIEGATVCIQADFGGPRLEDQCVLMEDGLVNGALTFESVTQLLFYANVDLSTAAGDFPEDVNTWTVRPALRRARVAPGPVARVTLSGTLEIYGGAPATLNGAVVDEFGNIVPGEVVFRYIDADGNVIQEVASEDGLATWQFQPPRLTPAITSIEPATFVDGDGTEYTGYAIDGQRMSQAAAVSIDGQPAESLGYRTGTISARELFMVAATPEALAELGLQAPTPIPSGARIVVTNPGGLASETITAP